MVTLALPLPFESGLVGIFKFSFPSAIRGIDTVTTDTSADFLTRFGSCGEGSRIADASEEVRLTPAPPWVEVELESER